MQNSSVHWRRLEKDEWDRLGDFLRAVHGELAGPPNPLTTEVIALVDADDEILAVMSCSLSTIISPLTAGERVPAEITDAVFVSGFESLRLRLQEYGIDGLILAANDPEAEAMDVIGFQPTGLNLYTGVV
jgi:hypothetical protein